MTEALKPCPFCGWDHPRYEKTITDHSVSCVVCFAKICRNHKVDVKFGWNQRRDRNDKPRG